MKLGVNALRATLCVLFFALFANFGFGSNVTGQIVTPNTAVGVANGTLTFGLNQAATVVGSFSVAASSTVCYTSVDGSVVQLPNPLVVPVVALNGAAGGLAGTYYVKVTYYGAGVETLASPAYVATVTFPNTQFIVSPPVLQPAAATGYKVYVGTTLGAETLQATTAGFVASTTIGSVSAGAALPSSNTTVCSVGFNDTFIPYGTWYNVALADANGTAVGGFPQRWVLQGSSVNLANGYPLANVANSLRFPTALILNPSSNAQQSVNSPLTINGYSLTAGSLQLPDNAAPPACATGKAVIWENSSHVLQACQNGNAAVNLLAQITNGWAQNGTDVRLATVTNDVLVGVNSSDLTPQSGGSSTGVKVGTFDYYVDGTTNAHLLAVGMLASPNNYSSGPIAVIGNGVSGSQMNGVPIVFIGCKSGDSCVTYGLTEFGRIDVGGQWHLGGLPPSTTEDAVTGAVMTRGSVSVTNGGAPSGTNFSVLQIVAAHGHAYLNTTSTGTESAPPLEFRLSGTVFASVTTAGGSGIMPGADVTYELGQPSLRWSNLYVGNFEILGGGTTDLSLANPFYVAVGNGAGFAAAGATTNASTGSFAVINGSYAALSSSKTGSGTYLPLAFFANGAEVARFARAANLDGSMLLGNTTTDLNLSGLPSFVALGGSLISATGISNASTLSLTAVASTYASIASSKTGAGSYLPMAFFVNGGEVARFPVVSTLVGSMLLGNTTTDLSITGSPFFVTVGNGTGFVSASASANASTMSMAVIGGSYAALSASKTAGGAYLPLAFFVNAQQRMSVDLTSNAVCVWVGGALHRLTLVGSTFTDGGAC